MNKQQLREANSYEPEWLQEMNSPERRILLADAFCNPIFNELIQSKVATLESELLNLTGTPEDIGKKYGTIKAQAFFWEELSYAAHILRLEAEFRNHNPDTQE